MHCLSDTFQDFSPQITDSTSALLSPTLKMLAPSGSHGTVKFFEFVGASAPVIQTGDLSMRTFPVFAYTETFHTLGRVENRVSVMCILHCEAEGLGEGSSRLVVEADGSAIDSVLDADVGWEANGDCDEGSRVVNVVGEDNDNNGAGTGDWKTG
jgi:hypothetical protein